MPSQFETVSVEYSEYGKGEKPRLAKINNEICTVSISNRCDEFEFSVVDLEGIFLRLARVDVEC